MRPTPDEDRGTTYNGHAYSSWTTYCMFFLLFIYISFISLIRMKIFHEGTYMPILQMLQLVPYAATGKLFLLTEMKKQWGYNIWS